MPASRSSWRSAIRLQQQVEADVKRLKGNATFTTGWRTTRTGNGDANWFLALNGFQYRVTGSTVGSGADKKAEYWVQVYKRYNWGTDSEGRDDVYWPRKSLPAIHVRQADWARLNTVGLARDYDTSGSAFFGG